MNFIKTIFREFFIYAMILFVGAVIIHGGDLFEKVGKVFKDPSKIEHAFLWALLFYFLVLIVRFIIKLILIIKNRPPKAA